MDGSVLQRLDHAGFSGVCKGAVIFAKMAAEAPFFINIYSFHGYAPFSAYSPACLMPRICKLFFVQTHAAQHKAVAAQRLDGVDAHAAHHFLDLVLPRGDKVHQALVADVRVEALHKVGALGCDAPVALAGLAASAQMAAERQKCRRADVAPRLRRARWP